MKRRDNDRDVAARLGNQSVDAYLQRHYTLSIFSDDNAVLIGDRWRTRAVHRKGDAMKKEYDFSKGRRNPYAKLLKRQVTIRLDQATIAYFKKLAEESEIPYQTLINLYLRDCASSKRRLAMNWTPPTRRVGA